MKALVVSLIVLVSSVNVFASDFGFGSHGPVRYNDSVINCTTVPVSTHASTSIMIKTEGPYDAVLTGLHSGGIAHFIRNIGPISLKVTHEVEMTIYENSEDGVEVSIVSSPVGGRILTSASFREGKNFPVLNMSCTRHDAANE